MLPLVVAAKSFSIRPSDLLAIEDPVLALNFDLAAAARLQQETADVEGPVVNRVII